MSNEPKGWWHKEVEELQKQLDWVKDVLSAHGYVGPFGDGCCPLAEWLNERESLRQQLTDSQKHMKMLRIAVKFPCHFWTKEQEKGITEALAATNLKEQGNE